MTGDAFDKLVDERKAAISAVLQKKAKEYSSAADRLYNFKRSAAFLQINPPRACIAFFMKHLTSIADMAENAGPPTTEMIEEKVGDAINYLILLEALLKEWQVETEVDDALYPKKKKKG